MRTIQKSLKIKQSRSQGSFKFSSWSSNPQERKLQGFIQKAQNLIAHNRSEHSGSRNDIYQTTSTLKTPRPQMKRKDRFSDKISFCDIVSDQCLKSGVDKFDPRKYVSFSKSIKNIGKRVSGKYATSFIVIV